MTDPPSIRRYESTDWDKISKVHDQARLVELELTVGTRAFRTLEATAAEEGLFAGDLWVAETDGEVAGFIVLSENEVTWLYVAPAHARQGVGRTLLRYVLAYHGGTIDVSVLDGNLPALGLYQSEEFEIVETRDGHLQGCEDVPARGHLLRRCRPSA